MHILVAYASRHGAAEGIAERIAGTLRSSGLEAQALPAQVRQGSRRLRRLPAARESIPEGLPRLAGDRGLGPRDRQRAPASGRQL